VISAAIYDGVWFMFGEEAVVFVWRCPNCPGVYDGESLLFLHSDGDHRYCPCGGRLVEDVAPGWGWRYRLVMSEYFKGTSLHRQLEGLLEDGQSVGVAPGHRQDRYINLLNSGG
jgi:hypothetical protein